MPGNEDLFTPIHKAIRSMIYDVGRRMQTNDFADPAASAPLLADLEHEFGSALSAGCLLCILHHHGIDEEKGVFAHAGAGAPQMIQRLMDEHRSLSTQLARITQHARELQGRTDRAQRILAGIALNQEVNEFFASYLVHMNYEERELVPWMKNAFTDDQMRAMRGAIMGGMPPERLAAILRWMLPSLNLEEASEMLGGLKRGAPAPVFEMVRGIAAAQIEPGRWAVVQERAGLTAPPPAS
jgi:hypothetical protein